MQAHRGRPAADRAALAELLARVSRLAEDVPEVQELDFNPVLVLPEGHGCHIVDVRVRVADHQITGGSGKSIGPLPSVTPRTAQPAVSVRASSATRHS
jgi:hypothetical protein